eukprot:s369_g5.t1
MQTLALPEAALDMPAPEGISSTAVADVKVEEIEESEDEEPAVDSCPAGSLANHDPPGAVAAAETQVPAPSAVAAAEASLLDEKMGEENAEELRRAQLHMRAEQKEKAEKAKEERKKAKEDKDEKKPSKASKAKAKPKGRPRKGNATEEEAANGPEDKPRKRKSTKKKGEKDEEKEPKSEAAEQPQPKKRARAATATTASRRREATRTENELDEEKVKKFLSLCRVYDQRPYDRFIDTLHKSEVHPKLTLVPYFTRPACGVKIKLPDGRDTQRIYMSGKYDTVAVNIQQCIYMADLLGQQDPDTFVEWCESEICLQKTMELERCAMAAKQLFFEEKQKEAKRVPSPGAAASPAMALDGDAMRCRLSAEDAALCLRGGADHGHMKGKGKHKGGSGGSGGPGYTMNKGKGPGKGAGRRPVPLTPRTVTTVPPRPKLMPTSVRHGGAWMQCFLWVPFQPGASPQSAPPGVMCPVAGHGGPGMPEAAGPSEGTVPTDPGLGSNAVPEGDGYGADGDAPEDGHADGHADGTAPGRGYVEGPTDDLRARGNERKLARQGAELENRHGKRSAHCFRHRQQQSLAEAIAGSANLVSSVPKHMILQWIIRVADKMTYYPQWIWPKW